MIYRILFITPQFVSADSVGVSNSLWDKGLRNRTKHVSIYYKTLFSYSVEVDRDQVEVGQDQVEVDQYQVEVDQYQ